MSIPIFINARTDIFFKLGSVKHTEEILSQALDRASAYAESGANGFFVPGLKISKYIEKLCELSPIPINVMMQPDMSSPKQLAQLGVARISYGPSPYCQTMDYLKMAAHRALLMS